MRPGVCNQPEQHGDLVSTENTKISWAWWGMDLIVPATQEAEAGGSLEEFDVVMSYDDATAL